MEEKKEAVKEYCINKGCGMPFFHCDCGLNGKQFKSNLDMKTGIELIAQERAEQIEKHGRTVAMDVEYNDLGQLRIAASALLTSSEENGKDGQMPASWDNVIAIKMCSKIYKERLIIAGALIAAEIDRLQANGD